MTMRPGAVNGEIQRPGEVEAAPQAPDTKSNIGARNDVVCATCPHPWSRHDRIAARFCTATATSGYRRGCVCTNKEIS